MLIAKHILEKYEEHSEHNLGTYLQYSDPSLCIHKALRATLLMGVMQKEKREKKVVPKAVLAQRWKLKCGQSRKWYKTIMTESTKSFKM